MSNIVAVKIDKVQSFIYDVIASQVQEKRVEDFTLRTIVGYSQEISEVFESKVKEQLKVKEDDIILSVSGKIILESSMEESEIRKNLNILFMNYYNDFGGKLLLKFVIFNSELFDKLEIVKSADKKLKTASESSQIIADNKDELFAFKPVKNKELPEIEKHKYNKFADNLDLLVSESDRPEDSYKYRIAVIKADLDGMGEFFKKQSDFNKYKVASDVLNQIFNMDSIHFMITTSLAKRLFPLYIAGDDIFIAVDVRYVFEAVNFLETILDKINENLKSVYPESNNLTMSMGIDITFNNQPIRYYYNRVEEQLRRAKKINFDKSFIKISMNDIDFIIKPDEAQNTSENIMDWKEFKNKVKLLTTVRNDANSKLNNGAVASPTWLNGLISKLETINLDNPRGLSSAPNIVFYHLLPKFFDRNKLVENSWNATMAELYLNIMLLKIFYTKTNSQSKLEFKLEFSKENINNFLKISKLLMFFADSRFLQEFNSSVKIPDLKQINRLFFNKILNYIKNTYSNSKLFKNFISQEYFFKTTEDKPNSGKNENNKVFYFRTVRINTSMLFKIKKLFNKYNDQNGRVKSLELVKKLINNNYSTSHNKEMIELDKLSNTEKPLYHKGLVLTEFYDYIHEFTKSSIDSLILFYSYLNLSIIVKEIKSMSS